MIDSVCLIAVLTVSGLVLLLRQQRIASAQLFEMYWTLGHLEGTLDSIDRHLAERLDGER